MIAISSCFLFRPSDAGYLVPSKSLPNNTLPTPARQLGRRLGPLLLLAALVLLFTGCTGRNLGASDEGWSPVVAAEGMVYVGTIQGQVLALKECDSKSVRDRECDSVRDSGDPVKLLWTFPANPEDSIGGVYNSPVIGPELVYVAALNGTLYALDKRTGSLEWERSALPGETGEPAALVGGPVLSPNDDTVLVGSEDGNLYAYDAETGIPSRGFPFQTGGKIWSTPAVKDGVVYFGSHDKNVYAVDLSSGELKWESPFTTQGVVVARPLLFKNLVIIGSFDKNLYALRAENGIPVWGGQSIPGIQLFEGAGNWFWAGAVANESQIFAPAMDGKIYATDKNGELLWDEPSQLGSPIVSTPVLVHQRLVVATRDGQVNLLDVQNGRIISGLPRLPSEVKAPLSAPPPTSTPTPTPTPPPASRRAPRPTATPSPLDPANQAPSPVDQSDSVFIGTQDGIVYRLRVTGQRQNHLWCFDTEEKKMLAITECSAAKE